MMHDILPCPYEPLPDTAMQRVTQYDIYLLGRVQGLTELRVGASLALHRQQLLLTFVTLNGFCKNDVNVSLLPRSVREAEVLATQVRVLEGESLGTGMSGEGILQPSSHEFLSRLLIAFETTLRQEMRELPTYVIERHGIYNADDLVSRADDCFSSAFKQYMPAIVIDDIKRAGACLAFDLFTACGFHAYRSLDGMLRAYFSHFASGATPPSSRDWGSFIRELRNCLTAAGGARRPNARNIELLDKIRSEDRNPLIHPEDDLERDDAMAAFELCKNTISMMAIDIRDTP
jgi:hypothetical protein